MTDAASSYPHGDTICTGCHACQPEKFPNVSAAYCGCHVCKPGTHDHADVGSPDWWHSDV